MTAEKITWRNSPWTVVIGFSLIALLAIFVGLLLPSRVADRSNPVERCWGHLKEIELAKRLWAEDENKPTNAVPTTDDLFATNSPLRAVLICPSGGIYTLGSVAEKPRCSRKSRSMFCVGTNSVKIRNFNSGLFSSRWAS